MQANIIRAISFWGVIFIASCGSGDDGGRVDSGGGGEVSCTVTATATADVGARTIAGIGRIECSQAASIRVETCVQWNPNGSFEDIQCMSSSQSGVAQLEVQNLASCGLGSGRRYRARVNASVNGTAEPEKLSADVGCE